VRDLLTYLWVPTDPAQAYVTHLKSQEPVRLLFHRIG
jgi:hypothetical protein